MSARAALLVALAFASGCFKFPIAGDLPDDGGAPDQPGSGPSPDLVSIESSSRSDLGSSPDLISLSDLDTNPDLPDSADSPDSIVSADLVSNPDLSQIDQALAPDLSNPPDLIFPDDLLGNPDLDLVPDLSPIPDPATPDLSTPPDLGMSPDLAFPPDMAVLRQGLALSFAAAIPYFNQPMTTAAIAGDFTADGKPDLVLAVAATTSTSKLSLRAGNGDGTFQVATEYAAANTINTLVAADVNGDGWLDVVAAESNEIEFFVSQGNSFAAGQGVVTTGALSLASGDLNGDGKLDLAWVDPAGGVRVAYGNGNGSFGTPVAVTAGTRPLVVRIADFNADNKADLAVLSPPDSAVFIRLSNGPGFASALQYPVNSSAVGLLTGDFVRDGRTDFVVLIAGSRYAEFSNTGLGGNSLFAAGASGTFPASWSWLTPIVGDFDSDGALDVAAAGGFSNDVVVLFGNNQIFYDTHLGAGAGPSVIASADFNADGRPDFAAFNATDQSLYVMLGSGSRVFGTPRYASGAGDSRVLRTGDFNADGRLDVVATTGFSGQSSGVDVLLNNGAGAFPKVRHSVAGQDLRGLAVGDWNNDRILDVAAADYATGNVYLCAGQGDGNFLPNPPSVHAGTHLQAAVSCDFNLDSRPDVAVTDAAGGAVIVLLNNNGNGFAPLVTYPTDPIAHGLALGDLNGDGRIDLLGGSDGARDVTVLLGFGDGTFMAAGGSPFPLGMGSPGDIATGDFDGDHHLDLATAGGVLSVLQGDGTGSLFAGAQTPVTLVGGSALGVAVADFNMDGVPDLAGTGTAVGVLLGNGDGTFQAPVYWGAGAGPDHLIAADVNADGKPDLLVAAHAGGVQVLLNTSR